MTNDLLVIDYNGPVARATKLEALAILATTIPRPDEWSAETMRHCVSLAAAISPEHFAAACIDIQKSWQDKWSNPQPGDMIGAALRIQGDAARARVATEQIPDKNPDIRFGQAFYRGVLADAEREPEPDPDNAFALRVRARRLLGLRRLAGVEAFPTQEELRSQRERDIRAAQSEFLKRRVPIVEEQAWDAPQTEEA